MKKFLLVAVILVFALSVIGCEADNQGNSTTAQVETASPTIEVTASPEATVSPVPEIEEETTVDEEEGVLAEEGTLEALLADIYANIENVDNEYKTWLQSMLMTTEITAENAEYYLGTADIDFAQAIASEPMISAQAYSLCLITLNEGADIEAAKEAIKTNVNPMKWICVGVDESDVIVENVGETVILIMSDHCNELLAAFQKVVAE